MGEVDAVCLLSSGLACIVSDKSSSGFCSNERVYYSRQYYTIHTETAPQVEQLTQKHAATQTQPYPPSGGGGNGSGGGIASLLSLGAESCTDISLPQSGLYGPTSAAAHPGCLEIGELSPPFKERRYGGTGSDNH